MQLAGGEKKSITILRDSGASVSLLKVKKLPSNAVVRYGYFDACGPSGETIPILGQAVIRLGRGDVWYEHAFWIVDDDKICISTDVLIGLDFMLAFGFDVSCRRLAFESDDLSLPLLPIEDKAKIVRAVFPVGSAQQPRRALLPSADGMCSGHVKGLSEGFIAGPKVKTNRELQQVIKCSNSLGAATSNREENNQIFQTKEVKIHTSFHGDVNTNNSTQGECASSVNNAEDPDPFICLIDKCTVPARSQVVATVRLPKNHSQVEGLFVIEPVLDGSSPVMVAPSPIDIKKG